MALERQEYPALLDSLEPEQAVDLLNGRVALVNKIHSDIADWLQERRRIEDQYATSLRKLARRPQQDNASALGVFQDPWQRIVNSTENMAQTHEQLAAKIQTDVESPLRHYHSTNREIQTMGNVAGNLAAIAKELSNAQKKAQKLDAKGSNKVDGARSSVEDASSQWSSQAPFVFEQLQALDEARINHLRDVLTQFQTHELDAVERCRASSEMCLNALLNVETADEIRTFAAKAKSQPGTTATRRDSLLGSSRPSGSNLPPVPPPPRQSSVDQRSNSLSGQDRATPLPEPAKKEKLSGLKRFGTVMSRRKNAAPPPVPSEKKKERTRSFAPFRRQESSRSFHDLESTGQDLSPAISRDDRASSRHESERPPQTQESRMSDAQPPPALNGVSSSRELSPGLGTTLPQIPALQPQNAASESLAPPQLSTPVADRRSVTLDPFSQQMNTPSSPVEDSARNFEIKDQPIPEDESEAQQAMNNIQNQLRLQAQNSGMNRPLGSVRGRRDVRNTMFIPSQPEMPSPSQTNLSSPGTPISAAATIPIMATANSATNLGGNNSELVTPVKRNLTAGSIPEDGSQITSDNQSVHSSHSMAGLAHHQEMSGPGLNASCVETVNTWFSDTGVTRSSVVGEIALAYTRPSSDAGNSHETVRLQNFHQLEKCAQNPQFITASMADSQPGTYNVALSPITRSLPTVAFKYQLHLDEATLSVASPLLLTQAWQLVEGQASAIIYYSLNPAFGQVANPGSSPRTSPQELTLKNVSITANLDIKPSVTGEATAKAIGAQMMPVQGAQFKKRSSAVVWKFPELVLKPSQERLLVRFTIENNGVAKRGGVDVKFEVPNALASALGVERLATAAEPATPAAQTSDPFADEAEARKSAEGGQRWLDVQSRKTLISGKYSAT